MDFVANVGAIGEKSIKKSRRQCPFWAGMETKNKP
jgi:hypothetical protein